MLGMWDKFLIFVSIPQARLAALRKDMRRRAFGLKYPVLESGQFYHYG